MFTRFVGILGTGGAALLLAFSPAKAADPPALPFIIDHVVARAEAEKQKLQSVQYDQVAVIDELDDSGRVIRHQERKSIVRPGTPNPVELVSVTGDCMPTDSMQRNRRGGFRENIDKGRQNFSLTKMVDRFNVTFEGRVDLAGQPAFLLGFALKPDQSSDNKIESVLNQLHGEVWISPINYSILRAKADLIEPVDVGWILATIEHLEVRYYFQGKDVEALVPAQMDIVAWASSPVLSSIHQEQKITVSNFTPRD